MESNLIKKIEELQTRFNALAKEKAHLSLINYMYKKLSDVKGYKNVIKTIFDMIMNFYGGLEIKIYYILNSQWHCYNLNEKFFVVKNFDDINIKNVIESKQYFYSENNLKLNTYIIDNKNKKISERNYYFPLISNDNIIGIVAVYRILVINDEMIEELLSFFSYSSIILNNELLNYNELNAAYIKLEKSLKEKSILLKEIHHRVKNNLQLISSLINLKMLSIDEPKIKILLKDLNSRIRSMGIIHEKLYQSSDFSKIDIKDYIYSLLEEIKSSIVIKKDIGFEIDIESVFFNIDTIVPFGLLVNEILTNSMKYAFEDIDNGKIYIKLYKEDNHYKLIIGDNGIGIPKSVNIEQSNSLGLKLIDALICQLKGKYKIDNNNGTIFDIELNYIENRR